MNRNTRKAYYHAISQFSHWCEARGLLGLTPMLSVSFLRSAMKNTRYDALRAR